MSFAGFLFLGSCSKSSPRQYIPADQIETIQNEKPKKSFFQPAVDIVFVIDDSGSMSSHQANLARNFPIFIREISRSGLDWQIGVLNSSCDPYSYTDCGLLQGNEKIVNPLTPNALDELQKNLIVGISGSASEKFFSPLMKALSPAFLQGANQGLVRRGAALAIVFVTDTEDQSKDYGPKETFKYLLQLKGGKSDRVLGYGAYIPEKDFTTCAGEETDPRRLEEFLGYFSNANPSGTPDGNGFLLCGDFGPKLAKISLDISERVSRKFYLKELPGQGTIVVKYGDEIVPPDFKKGWSYDIQENAIVLGSEFQWDPPGSSRQIDINYEVAKP